jgi:16S rRNA G966 N2-methylase RsmD
MTDTLEVFNDLKYRTVHLPIQTTKLPDGALALFHLTKKHIEKYMCLSDEFHVVNRLSGRRNDQDQSPMEYLENNREEIEKLAKEQYKGSIFRALNSKIKGCSHFSPFLTVMTLRYFNARRILDFSAGWGDRLIGCLARDDWIDYYCGIDPNKQLTTGYKNMIKTYAPKHSRKKYEIICGPAEKEYIPLANGRLYDLVFTSPPFYDKEIYTDKGSQSINDKSYEQWLDEFLLYVIGNVYDLLEMNGHLVLHLSDEIIDSIRNKVSQYMKYEGLIYIGDPKYQGTKYEKMIVFEKIKLKMA